MYSCQIQLKKQIKCSIDFARIFTPFPNPKGCKNEALMFSQKC